MHAEHKNALTFNDPHEKTTLQTTKKSWLSKPFLLQKDVFPNPMTSALRENDRGRSTVIRILDNLR